MVRHMEIVFFGGWGSACLYDVDVNLRVCVCVAVCGTVVLQSV